MEWTDGKDNDCEVDDSGRVNKVIHINDNDDVDDGADKVKGNPIIVVDDTEDVKVVNVSANPTSNATRLLMFHPYVFPRKSHCGTPTWNDIHIDCCEPKLDHTVPVPASKIYMYKLYLISQTEFSISESAPNCSSKGMQRLRVPIRKITRAHGHKAAFDDRWRIPLSVYQPIFTYLSSDKNNVVEGIPESQIKIVALARAAAMNKESTIAQLVQLGVPPFLASSLAPYQRAGVDFILQRQGRALLADEMGLGKSIQSIAAMCCFFTQWPLLILAPSSATHHWEAEFIQWLGHTTDDQHHLDSKILGNDYHQKDSVSIHCAESSIIGHDSNRSYPVISTQDIYIIQNSKHSFRLNPRAKVVICSYGLACKMAGNSNLVSGDFNCIIADESHLLKNRSSIRTKRLLPILKAAERLILLSGTPALSRPIELYPQISALGNMGLLWRNEDDYIQKYCRGNVNDQEKGGSRTNGVDSVEQNRNLAELHTLLTSTIMLRRRKLDILKFLPPKTRERVYVNTRDQNLKQTMQDSLVQLTKGNGIMANIKRCKLFNDWTNTKSDSSSNISSSVSGPSQRKLVLNQLYCHAGTAKIPLLLEMLNKFIMDPSKGKVCIFAHHLAVIEALIQQSKLSEMDCACQYIRIDGSTSPKDRQIQVIRFQSDPNVRIAILGITSAGVALTLTAASTVWFAELYWTPAMLLQSEDRCHRIGQQATVRCVYFVARGSLDELLWKLIEKKYSELGEFVEGKGNENIVINHDFLDELDAMNTWFADDGECNKLPSHPDEECGSDTTIFLGIADDEDIGRFIEELGQEENSPGDNNDDISIIEGTVGLQSPSVSLKPNAAVSVNEDLDYPQKGVVPTKGVVDVIEISDDEGDISCDKDMKLNGNATSPNSHSQVSIQSLIDRHAEYSTDDFVKEICAILPQTPLHTLRLYRFFFPQNFTLTSGLQFFCGRFMNMRRYSNSLGESCRPGVGDVVVAIQGRILQPLSHQQHATRFISIAEATFKSQQYIEIIFGEDPLFQALADILNRKRIAAV